MDKKGDIQTLVIIIILILFGIIIYLSVTGVLTEIIKNAFK